MYKEITPVTHHFYPLQEHTTENEKLYQKFLSIFDQKKVVASDSLIYIHIPYCEKHCLFCPFHIRVQKDYEVYQKYINALIKEIELLSQKKYVQSIEFNAVYFGGGSPSLVPLDLIEKLYGALCKNLHISKNAEWTFEGEPHGLANKDLMAFLAEKQFLRISYGIQTFDRKMRELLTIAATVDDVIECLELSRKFHIPEVNIDMLYYLPGHTLKDLEYDIQKIKEYGFDSVDYYYLSYYGFPKKVFIDMEKGLFPPKPPVELRFEMHEYVCKRMVDENYYHVTDHVFSRKPKGSDYYRILWGGGDGEYRAETLAIGCSARGYLNGVSYANLRNHNQYIDAMNKQEMPIYKFSESLPNPEDRGAVFFPKFFKIKKEMVKPNSRHFSTMRKLINNGLVIENSDYYEITPEGKKWIPNMTLEFFDSHQLEINNLWLDEMNNKNSNLVTR